MGVHGGLRDSHPGPPPSGRARPPVGAALGHRPPQGACSRQSPLSCFPATSCPRSSPKGPGSHTASALWLLLLAQHERASAAPRPRCREARGADLQGEGPPPTWATWAPTRFPSGHVHCLPGTQPQGGARGVTARVLLGRRCTLGVPGSTAAIRVCDGKSENGEDAGARGGGWVRGGVQATRGCPSASPGSRRPQSTQPRAPHPANHTFWICRRDVDISGPSFSRPQLETRSVPLLSRSRPQTKLLLRRHIIRKSHLTVRDKQGGREPAPSPADPALGQ